MSAHPLRLSSSLWQIPTPLQNCALSSQRQVLSINQVFESIGHNNFGKHPSNHKQTTPFFELQLSFLRWNTIRILPSSFKGQKKWGQAWVVKVRTEFPGTVGHVLQDCQEVPVVKALVFFFWHVFIITHQLSVIACTSVTPARTSYGSATSLPSDLLLHFALCTPAPCGTSKLPTVDGLTPTFFIFPK